MRRSETKGFDPLVLSSGESNSTDPVRQMAQILMAMIQMTCAPRSHDRTDRLGRQLHLDVSQLARLRGP
jgi:hypothetical protein